MQARLFGIRLQSAGKISTREFLDDVVERGQIAVTRFGAPRILRVKLVDGEYLGIVVTIRDARNYLALREQRTIVLHQTETNERIMEVNPFVLRADTFRGVYLNYRASTSPTLFFTLLGRQHRRLKLTKKRADLGRVVRNDAETMAQQRTRIRQEYEETTFHTSELLQPQEYEALVRRMTRVSSFRFSFSSVALNTRDMAPPTELRDIASNVTTDIRFKQEATLAMRKSQILQLAARVHDRLLTGQVYGVRHDGTRDPISIMQNIERFAYYDYDTVAPQFQDIEIEAFDTVTFYQELRQFVQDKPVFRIP